MIDTTNDQADQAQPPSGDQAATFAALTAEASALEGGGLVAPGAPAAAAVDTTAQAATELYGALELARLMVAPMFGWWHDFGKVWGDDTLARIADSGAKVMERHGWTTGGLLSEFGPYLALIGATAPPSFVTYQAIRAQRERQARAARETGNATASTSSAEAGT